MKKIVALFLTLALLISAAALPALAEGETETTVQTTSETRQTGRGGPGCFKTAVSTVFSMATACGVLFTFARNAAPPTVAAPIVSVHAAATSKTRFFIDFFILFPPVCNAP